MQDVLLTYANWTKETIIPRPMIGDQIQNEDVRWRVVGVVLEPESAIMECQVLLAMSYGVPSDHDMQFKYKWTHAKETGSDPF